VSEGLERGGCVIAGVAGVGKSRLAAEAAMSHGAPVVRVVATTAAASIPFGAFGHLLASVETTAVGAIPAYVEALGRHASAERPTLLVDDAHLLDEASAALVLTVRESEAARVLVTLRRGEAAPDAITALWKERRLARLDLEPLSRGELRALVESHLGGSADADVHARVLSLTEGNPLYAHELLIDARRSGALANADGRWRWTGKPPEMLRLRDLIDAHTNDLSSESRLALELLAVGAPLGLDELAAVSSVEAAAELERAGLATVRGQPESPAIELAHPMFGEVTLAALPAATARLHRRRLAAVLSAQGGSDPLTLLRLATLKLESGESDPELFLRAARHALDLQSGVPGAGWAGGDPKLAIRLADAAGQSLEAALCGARGRMALGRFAELEERLAPLEGEAARAQVEQATEYVRSRVYALYWGGARTAQALALLERSRSWHQTPDWAAARAALTGWILLDRSQPAGTVEVIEALADHSELPPHTRLDTLLALGVAHSRLGLIDRCEALEPEILRLVDELEERGWATGWARYMVDGLARVEVGRDLPEVAARLAEGRDSADARGDAALAAALGMVLGRLHLIRGHVRDAIPVLEDAAGGLVAGDPRNGLGLTLTYLSRAYAATGDAAGADATLTRAEAVSRERPNSVSLRLEVDRARAWVDVARGRLSAAMERLLALADDTGEAVASEAEALYEAVRLGAAPQGCAPRLAELAGRAESELLAVCADHAAAVAAGDLPAQLEAAERFAELGLDLLAAEAAARAGAAFAAAGRASPARRAAALAAKHAALCPGAVTPALTLTPQSEGLTPREREVAILAARGRPNAEIANELVLSVRTVETYVLRACRKLGVNTRADLARVLTPEARS
jgi:DNA-binding CsgD family transcriptional regulator